MRILYTMLYEPKCGLAGSEKVFYDLITTMKERPGIEVFFAVNRGELYEKLKTLGIPGVQIYRSRLNTQGTIRGLFRAVREFRPDILHSHHRYTTFLADFFLKSKIKIIHTEHVLRCDKRLFFRFGHLATAVHETVRAHLIEYFKIPAEKVITIANAVSIPDPDPVLMEDIQRRNPHLGGKTVFLMIGRFDRQKGHADLVQAIAKLPVQYQKKIHVFFAGDGPLEQDFRQQVLSKGIGHCTQFLGYCRQIPEYLSLCDCLVLPSLWEGMPLVILEAFCLGRPVLATDIPGTRETVRHGETGILVPSRDPSALAAAIMDMIEHPEQVKKMGHEAMQSSHHDFSFDSMMTGYANAYQRVLTQ